MIHATADLRVDGEHECAGCGREVADEDVTYVRVGGVLLPYCTDCGDALWPEDEGGPWADTAEEARYDR